MPFTDVERHRGTRVGTDVRGKPFQHRAVREDVAVRHGQRLLHVDLARVQALGESGPQLLGITGPRRGLELERHPLDAYAVSLSAVDTVGRMLALDIAPQLGHLPA